MVYTMAHGHNTHAAVRFAFTHSTMMMSAEVAFARMCRHLLIDSRRQRRRRRRRRKRTKMRLFAYKTRDGRCTCLLLCSTQLYLYIFDDKNRRVCVRVLVLVFVLLFVCLRTGGNIGFTAFRWVLRFIFPTADFRFHVGNVRCAAFYMF